METPTVNLTRKIHDELLKVAKESEITQEGLTNVALRLFLSDKNEIDKVVNLIKTADLGGAGELTNKGW